MIKIAAVGALMAWSSGAIGQQLTIDDAKLSHAAYCLGAIRYDLGLPETQSLGPAIVQRQRLLVGKLSSYVLARALLSSDIAWMTTIAESAGARDTRACTAATVAATECLKRGTNFQSCDLAAENGPCDAIAACADVVTLY